ncbi:MAG: DNA polymerase/3'-5' exonuclease PolX [Gemmatimonadetes bacterium]|nr:MAG: DNA polymerase/3'-5' exonuclease PolX [Gemmatimonadota bacterium]
MENVEIAQLLTELADLLEIQGANPFRVRAYRNAARTVRDHPGAVADLVEAGEDLSALPGIGKDLAGQLATLVRTGRLPRLEEVAAEVPRSLARLVQLDGVGPKKARKLWTELGVTTIDELERAIEEDRVAALEGFGPTSVARIREAIEHYRRQTGRFRLDVAEELIRPLVAHLEAAPTAERVVVAGSYRRRRDTVGDIDILVVAEEGWSDLMERFTTFRSVERVVSAGETRGSVVLRSGLEVDLRVVPAASAGAALQYFTGSQAHSVALRQIAVRQGLSLNEWGVYRAEDEAHAEPLAGATEEEVYDALGLPWIPPELRENRGEIEAAREGRLPELVALEDLRGDLHMHSTWSDGKASIEEMARACARRGYAYMVISDHSPALAMVGGLTPERARQQWAELDRVREAVPDIRIYRGMEVDILRDGALDMDDEVLAELDVVIISVHSLMDMDGPTMTERVLRAMAHPAVDILGHPTGRILGKREPYALDVEAVLQAARDLDVAVEINANPRRLDLNEIHARRARELGVKVAISTDAHSLDGLEHMRFGVDQGRRGWLQREDVLNAMEPDDFERWLRRRAEGRA